MNQQTEQRLRGQIGLLTLLALLAALAAVCLAPRVDSPPPQAPSSAVNYNDEFATVAEQCASRADVKIGSIEWINAAGGTQPWNTGGNRREGWNMDCRYVGDAAALERFHQLVISNIGARPNAYPFAPLRSVAYQIGERPLGWMWNPTDPFGKRDAMDGALIVDGVPCYPDDSEHFLKEPICCLAMRPETFPMGEYAKWGGAPLVLDTRSWARVLVTLAQWSCIGEIRPWFNNHDRGSDRVAHRLLYALLRTSQVVGLDGQNAIDGQAWIAWLYNDELTKGVYWFTNKEIITVPQIGLPWVTGADGQQHLSLSTNPYWNPTQTCGYGIPAWYWLDQALGSNAHLPLVQKLCAALVAVVGDDGSVPWAVDKSGVFGYFAPANGDKYTPGYENYAALRIAEKLGIQGAATKAKAIRDRWASRPDGDNEKELERPWFVDADRKPAW